MGTKTIRRIGWMVLAAAVGAGAVWTVLTTDALDLHSGQVDGPYIVRGVVERMPSDSDPALHIHHEDMPSFRDRSGKPVGMPAMAMPFAPMGAVDLGELTKGDKVRFTFFVHWDKRPMLRMTTLTRLPADTSLKL